VLRESGTDGSGGGPDVNVAVGDALLFDPVRPARLLAVMADCRRAREDLPTEALVAPPLVSQGFGGDGEDMCARAPPHRSVGRVLGRDGSRCRFGADVVDGALQTSRGWRPAQVEASLRGWPGVLGVKWADPRQQSRPSVAVRSNEGGI
jgi:hypothetical protein